MGWLSRKVTRIDTSASMATQEKAALSEVDCSLDRDSAKQLVGVTETGSFARGECTCCGWHGPGRRARDVAAEDAQVHKLTGCTPSESVVARVHPGEEAGVPAQ